MKRRPQERLRKKWRKKIVKRWLQKRFRNIWKDKMKPLSTAALPAGYHDRWSNLTKQNNDLCAWIESGENIIILNLAGGGSKLDIYCRLFFDIFWTFNSFVIVNLVSRQFVMFQMWNNWGYSNLPIAHIQCPSPFIIQIECVCHYMTCHRMYACMCVLKK